MMIIYIFIALEFPATMKTKHILEILNRTLSRIVVHACRIYTRLSIPMTPNKSSILVVVVAVIRHCRQCLQSAQQAKEWHHEHDQIVVGRIAIQTVTNTCKLNQTTQWIQTLTERMYAIGVVIE